MNSRGALAKLCGVAGVIAAVTIFLLWPAIHNEFLFQWDDWVCLEESQQHRRLSWDTIRWAFTTVVPFSYLPLIRLMHVLNFQLWGMQAAGYHATSVLLHGLNAGLVTVLIWTLLGKIPSVTEAQRQTSAAFVGLVFGIHPLQVEPVAWLTQQIIILSTFFSLSAMYAYLWLVQQPRNRCRYGIVLLLLVAALLSKVTAVALVLLMLTIDFYPLQRHLTIGWRGLLKEKLLWFALCAGMSGLFLWAAAEQHGLVSLARLGMMERGIVAVRGVVSYLEMLLWPAHLSPYYPIQGRVSLGQLQTVLSVAAFAAITTLTVVRIRRIPGLFAAWVAYLALLLPSSGLVQVGSHAAADRYMYMAMLPPLMCGALGIVWAWRRMQKFGRTAIPALVGCWLVFLAVKTREQIGWWHEDETVWRAVLQCYPQSEHAHWQLGNALAQKGQPNQAIDQYREALRINPDYAEAHIGIGVALAATDRLNEAITHYAEAVRLAPASVEAHYSWGTALGAQARWAEAIEQYQITLQISPRHLQAQNNLGVTLARVGRTDEAIAHLTEALRLEPDDAEAHNNLGIILAAQGKLAEAIAHYREALRTETDDAELHNNLGVALEREGKSAEAVAQFREAMRLKPDWPTAMANLTWTLATSTDAEVRDGKEAVRIGEQACTLTGFRDARTLDTLGAAYGEDGQWAKAVQTAQKARDMARVAGQVELAREIQQRLDLYKSSRPFRQIVSSQEHL